MKKLIIAFSLCVASGLSTAVTAATWTYAGGINSAQSAAAHAVVGLTGFEGGFLTASLNDVTGLLNWTIGFGGLSGPAVAAHFHAAPPGVDGPLALATPSLIGSTSGLFSGSAIVDAGAIDLLTGSGAAVVGDIIEVYHNIHTAINPLGEIRGQLFVTAVPLPAGVWLLLSALGIMGLRRRTA